MAEFLFEIGLEEVPARMIAGAQAELLKRTLALLEREQLVEKGAGGESYSTPRRLAVLVRGVREQQQDVSEEVVGPAVKIAFKEGVPTAAAEAFARKSGVAVAELRTVTTSKGEYLAATSLKKGRSAAEVIATELPKEIAGIYWAKNMYWRTGKPERFVRPVLWMLCLLGDAVVPVSFGGRTAGRATFGHRVLSSGEPFEVMSPGSYVAQLEGEFVLADVEVRRQKIRKALDKVTRVVSGARWREDEALVDQVTHLTEWPDVLLGDFEATYLELPEEVLVTVMRDHQKYFAVEAGDGKLAPHFLAVLNIALTGTNAPVIQQGNERVLRARFNDAKFFWEFDQRTPLAERVKLLEGVTFQKDLGSYAAKTERVRKSASFLSEAIQAYVPRVDAQVVDRAALLAKADLTSELVKEFTELQGVIGGLYAKYQQESEGVDRAIYDQYKPAGAQDSIPTTIDGAILGIVDRMDTITGMFFIGMAPTGSKDPFALRRAANAVVRIIAETEIGNFPSILADAARVAKARYVEPDTRGVSVGSVDDVMAFFRERIEFYLRDVRGHSYDVVDAVMAVGFQDVKDVLCRAKAVTAMRGSEDFLAVCSAFKRMKNLVDQTDASGISSMPVDLPVEVTIHPAYRALSSAVMEISATFDTLRKNRDYVEALKLLATLRPNVDAFMDPKTGVRVLDDVPWVRESNVNLLRQILVNFSSIADFSKIVVAS